jgi:hypothetical protein
MHQIELVPDLSHCIETVAKKEYRETIERILNTAEASNELEEKAEILRLFLQAANFKRLRTESERYLVSGRKVKFVVCLQNGSLRYNIQET